MAHLGKKNYCYQANQQCRTIDEWHNEEYLFLMAESRQMSRKVENGEEREG